MHRLRFRADAASVAVSIVSASTSYRGYSYRPITATTLDNGKTIVASIPIATAAPSTLALIRRSAAASPTFVQNVSTMMLSEQMRFVRAKSNSSSSAEEQATGSSSTEQATGSTNSNTADQSTGTSSTDAKPESEANAGAEGEEGAKKKKVPPKAKSFREQFQALKQDMKDFPDIYNSVNLVHFFIFTIFCLCSTGSNVEEQWWLNNWGIDKTFAPWAWPLHSLLTNNFLSMTFAMLLLHSMCHSVMTTLGPKMLWQYMGIVAVASGAMMWGLNNYMGWSHEKQFGPWDVCSSLFVMQYLHQGLKPWQLILSFNGWVKYAMCVGSICILYYDWQPVVFGTGVGFALCKLHPRLRGIKPPV
eukprot:GILI01019698.1.p1 GENE.GILI01019698.1~~GILI01019698.1.p1  ORF type:complete len:360 (+),score=88.13 GILI01019698.1:67-1146(+)